MADLHVRQGLLVVFNNVRGHSKGIYALEGEEGVSTAYDSVQGWRGYFKQSPYAHVIFKCCLFQKRLK